MIFVDPHNITNYYRTDEELEAFLMFCPAVAGKTAVVISKKLMEFLTKATVKYSSMSPLSLLVKMRNAGTITKSISEVGLGKNTLLTKSFTQMANLHEAGLNLRTCTANDLEKINGIGFKTSRFFLLHSRKEQNIAVLDTHILAFLRDKGIDAPRQTPSNAKKYAELEKIVLKMARQAKKSATDFDLWIWRKYTKTKPIII